VATGALLDSLSATLPPHGIVVGGRAAPTLNLTLSGVTADLIRCAYPLLEPLVEADGDTMLALPDIAAMKLAAMPNRGGKKDCVDLCFLPERSPLQTFFDFQEGRAGRPWLQDLS
jgi:hypothetical protein